MRTLIERFVPSEAAKTLAEVDGQIHLSVQELEEVLSAVAKREPYESLAARIGAWRHEPTKKRLTLFAEQAARSRPAWTRDNWP